MELVFVEGFRVFPGGPLAGTGCAAGTGSEDRGFNSGQAFLLEMFDVYSGPRINLIRSLRDSRQEKDHEDQGQRDQKERPGRMSHVTPGRSLFPYVHE